MSTDLSLSKSCEKHCDIIITEACCVLAVFGVDNIIIDSQSASIYPSSVDAPTQTTLSLLDMNETLMLLMLPLLQIQVIETALLDMQTNKCSLNNWMRRLKFRLVN